MSENAGSLGVFLKSVRVRNGLSLRETSRRAEPPIHSSHLSQIESGKVRYPSIAILPQLSQAYGVAVSQILEASGIEVHPDPNSIAATEAHAIGRRVLELDESSQRSALSFIAWLQHEGSQTR